MGPELNYELEMLWLFADATPKNVSSHVYAYFRDIVVKRECLSVDLIARGEGLRSLIINGDPS